MWNKMTPYIHGWSLDVLSDTTVPRNIETRVGERFLPGYLTVLSSSRFKTFLWDFQWKSVSLLHNVIPQP